jgi:hypothetical protein
MGGPGSGNPHPKLENLKSLPRVGDEPLGERLSVRFDRPVEAVLKQMSSPDRQAYIRKAVADRMRAEGLLEQQKTAPGEADG